MISTRNNETFYNADRKEFYLDSIATNKAQMTTIFFKSREIEENLCKDLCDFEFVDYIMLFNHNSWCNLNTFRNRKSRINHYIRWCMENGYCDEKAFSNIKNLRFEDISKKILYENTHFKHFSDLERLINKALDQMDTEQRFNMKMNIAVVYLLWSGFTSQEIIDMKRSDVNWEARTISGIKVDIPEVINLVGEVSKMDTYYKIKKNNTTELCSFDVSDSLIRTPRTEKISDGRLKHLVYMLNLFLEKLDILDIDYGKRLLTADIYNSGLFSRIKKIEDETGMKINPGKKRTGEGNNKEIFQKLMDGRLFSQTELDSNDNHKLKEYLEYRKYFYYI